MFLLSQLAVQVVWSIVFYLYNSASFQFLKLVPDGSGKLMWGTIYGPLPFMGNFLLTAPFHEVSSPWLNISHSKKGDYQLCMLSFSMIPMVFMMYQAMLTYTASYHRCIGRKYLLRKVAFYYISFVNREFTQVILYNVFF